VTIHLLVDIFSWFEELKHQGVNITDGPIGAKAQQEIKEFRDNPSLEEAADVIISICGSVFAMGHSWRDLHQAVRHKMIINRHRKWARQADGTYQHV
jgi:hypothetical protein